MNLPEHIFKVRRLILGDTSKWCKYPYSGHPDGCPNFGKADKCPPKAPHVEDYFNMDKALFLVHSVFPLYLHIKVMKEKHPDWSDRQLRCVLYWQGTSRKQLNDRMKEASGLLFTNASTTIPEAMGVNVYATAKVNGLSLERIRNLQICRHVGLIGWRRGEPSLF